MTGTSAALFAPAWTWECGERATWQQRDQLLWDGIAQHR